MIAANPELFTVKKKSITYTGVFVKLYNQRNYGQVYNINRMVEFEKQYNSIVKNLQNLGFYYIVEISSICIVYISSLKIRRGFYFISITILIGITSTNYILLIGQKKIYKI